MKIADKENCVFICIDFDGCRLPAKGRPRFTRFGGVYTPATTEYFERKIKASYIDMYGNKKFDSRSPLRAEIEILHALPKNMSKKRKIELNCAPDTRKPDLDNVAKLVMDALNGVAYDDDKQITSMSVSKVNTIAPYSTIYIYISEIKEVTHGTSCA